MRRLLAFAAATTAGKRPGRHNAPRTTAAAPLLSPFVVDGPVRRRGARRPEPARLPPANTRPVSGGSDSAAAMKSARIRDRIGLGSADRGCLMKKMTATVLAALGCLAAAQAQAARVEIPIRQTVLPDGEIRYSVPIRLGATAVEAMLDTGSTGIRVLPGTLVTGDFTPSGTSSNYSYGSGAELRGVVARATLSLGEVAGPVSFEAVQIVDCEQRQPHCPVSRVAPADYGIGGSGIPKQGFRAIFGTLFRPAEVDNPLIALGVNHWIVLLPRPGDSEPGKLILNPSAEETAGYTMFRLPQPKVGSAVPGCLINDNTSARICGRVLFDTGAPGLHVESQGAIDGFPWPAGTVASLVLQDERGHRGGLRFTVGSEHHAGLGIDPNSNLPFARISGAVPFYAVSVLYDASTGEVGIKPR